MTALKPMAGLTSGLLARKGGARPAMRSQLFASLRQTEQSAENQADLDDLGWNDMGEDAPETAASQPDTGSNLFADRQDFLAKRIQFSAGAALLDETPLEPEGDEAVHTPAATLAGGAASSLLALNPPVTREVRRAVTVRINEERYSQLREVCHGLGWTAPRAISEALEQWLAARSARQN
ncbi:hypothetical protein [Novosphingobium sp.]|uniref:hypothetical protein n=1 Tax=Novosphingobium sp. TaxID=1874826 RepID=UPI0035AFD9B5